MIRWSGRWSELQAWVDKLGAMEPDEIRKLMQDEGVVGRRADADACPIANFLQAKCGRWIGVTGHWINTSFDGGIHTPYSVGVFVGKFDGGDYPELVIS